MSAATKAAVATLRAEGLLDREIAERLGLSASTVSRHTAPGDRIRLRDCVQCGRSFSGRANRLVCGPECAYRWQAHLQRERRRMAEELRRRSDERARALAAMDRERGLTVEEWLAERRPAWARDERPAIDAWAGYSADAAEVSA